MSVRCEVECIDHHIVMRVCRCGPEGRDYRQSAMAPMKAMKAMKAGGKPMTKGSLAEALAGETELKRSVCMKVFESIDTDHDSAVNAKFADLKRRRAEFASIGAMHPTEPRRLLRLRQLERRLRPRCRRRGLRLFVGPKCRRERIR